MSTTRWSRTVFNPLNTNEEGYVSTSPKCKKVLWPKGSF